MFRSLIVFAFCASPAVADTSMVQRLAGFYGDQPPSAAPCKGVQQQLSFWDRNNRGTVQVFEHRDGEGKSSILDLPFTVRRSTARGLEIRFDSEEFHTGSGELVTWEFRPLRSPAGYCWYRTDWTDAACINTVQRCEDEVPIS